MRSSRFTTYVTAARGSLVLCLVILCALLAAPSSARQSLPLEPPKDAGMGITPAFEGWYRMRMAHSRF